MSDTTFSVSRDFAAAPERVWEAWTQPERFSQWFGTRAVTVPLDELTMDVRVGGTWTARMHLPDGNTIDWAGEYTELDEPTRLAFTITDRPAEPAGDPVVVDIEPTAEGSRMTLTQSRDRFDDEQVERTSAGYAAFFDVMAEELGVD